MTEFKENKNSQKPRMVNVRVDPKLYDDADKKLQGDPEMTLSDLFREAMARYAYGKVGVQSRDRMLNVSSSMMDVLEFVAGLPKRAEEDPAAKALWEMIRTNAKLAG